jgi:altronate dehydratase
MIKSEAPVLRVNPRDNVAVALARLNAGDWAHLDGVDVQITEPIPFGHKLALAVVPVGGGVVKYGEVIGRATSPIEAGQHVHVHNLQSARLPGPIRS